MHYIVKYLKFFIIYAIFSNQFVKADNDTNTSADIPDTNTNVDIPDTNSNADIPDTNANADIPDTNANADIPDTNANADISDTNANADIPDTNANTDIPATNANANIPDTNVNADIPDTNANADIPDTNANADIPDTNANHKVTENLDPVSQTTTENKINTELAGNCTVADTPLKKRNYSQSDEPVDWEKAKNITAVFSYMQSLARNYPKQATLHEVGTSQSGSPIYALEVVYSIYTGATVVIDAGMTSTDRVAVTFALYVLHNLVELLSSNISTLTGVKFIVIPLVNPDEYMQPFGGMQSRACREPFFNNFDIGEPPQHSVCGSAKFLTEREVKHLASYYSNIRDFKLYLNIHSGTSKIGFPYGYKKEIADNVVIEMADNMRNVIDSKLVPKKATMSSLNTMFGDHPGSAVDWVYEKLAVPFSFYLSIDADENDRTKIFRAYYDALRYGVLQIQLTDPNVAKAIYRDCSGNQKMYPNNMLILYISLITMSLKIINF